MIPGGQIFPLCATTSGLWPETSLGQEAPADRAAEGPNRAPNGQTRPFGGPFAWSQLPTGQSSVQFGPERGQTLVSLIQRATRRRLGQPSLVGGARSKLSWRT